jgi:hypothetical protein
MGNDRQSEDERDMPTTMDPKLLPTPSASYRRQAWIAFQRALDPLAPIKPLPPPRP